MPAGTTGPHKAAIHYPGFVFLWLQKWIINSQIKIIKFYSPDCVALVIYVLLFVTQCTAAKTQPDLCRFKKKKKSFLQPHCVKISLFLHHLCGNFAIQNPISVSLEDFLFFVLQDRDPIKQPVPSLGDGSCHVNNDLQPNSICRHSGPAWERRAGQICLLCWGRNTDGKERHKYHSGVLDHAKKDGRQSKGFSPEPSTGNFDLFWTEQGELISLDGDWQRGLVGGESERRDHVVHEGEQKPGKWGK